MAKFDIDDISAVIHRAGYRTAGGGADKALLLIQRVQEKPRLDKTIGGISMTQFEHYCNTSDSVAEAGRRIIDHVVNGRPSDLSTREIGLLAQQEVAFKQLIAESEERARQQHERTIAVFAGEIQKINDAVNGKNGATPTLPPSATEIAVTPPISEVVSDVPRGTPADAVDADAVQMAAKVESDHPHLIPESQPLSSLGLSNRAANRLTTFATIGDLLKISRKELRHIEGMGEGSLDEIEQKLAERGLHLIGWKRKNVHTVKPKRAPRGAIKHVTRLPKDLVLKWAADVDYKVPPEQYDAKGELLGWVVARIKKLHQQAFGMHPLRPDTQQRQDEANQKAGIEPATV